MVQKKVVQKTAQKTVQKTVHSVGSVARTTGRWLWNHRDYVAHGAMVAVGIIGIVSGTNKLVHGHWFLK